MLVGGIYDKLLAEVCRQLKVHGLKLHEVEATIVDATLIVSAARPHASIDAPQDRCEEEISALDEVNFSADADARWVKKGGKSTLDYNYLTTDQKTPRLSTIRMRMGRKPGLE